MGNFDSASRLAIITFKKVEMFYIKQDFLVRFTHP